MTRKREIEHVCRRVIPPAMESPASGSGRRGWRWAHEVYASVTGDRGTTFRTFKKHAAGVLELDGFGDIAGVGDNAEMFPASLAPGLVQAVSKIVAERVDAAVRKIVEADPVAALLERRHA